jgi:hypothetical protein
MARGHIPYRGEAHPKLYGHPAKPDWLAKEKEWLFGFFFGIPGIILLYLNFVNGPGNNRIEVFLLFIYLLFGIVIWFAFKDIKKIETLTPDVDSEKDDSALAEDYIEQIHWQTSHRYNRYVTKEWKYQPVHKFVEETPGQGCAYIFAPMIGFPIAAVFITWLSNFLGYNSGILFGILIGFGIVILLGYLLRQELKG